MVAAARAAARAAVGATAVAAAAAVAASDCRSGQVRVRNHFLSFFLSFSPQMIATGVVLGTSRL